MRIPILLTTIAFAVLSLAVSNNNSTAAAGSSVPAIMVGLPDVTSQAATQFSSAYTPLTKCGSGMTKKEEKEAEKNGTDIPSWCKGLGGYHVYISYSACSAGISVDRGEESISLGMQSGDWKQKAIEWRLANGKPFAVIFRVYEYGGDDQCATNGKIVGESLIVKGLKGYEQIDEEINARTTPNPNVKAREIADKGYAKGPS